jgi:Zn-dependent metalloprotease
MASGCGCFIVPQSVLDRFSKDTSLSTATRAAFRSTAQMEVNWRTLRMAHMVASQVHLAGGQSGVALAPAPAITVSDCNGSTSLPGTPVPNPEKSSDPTAKRCFNETTGVAKFYKACFGRNSVDDLGMTLASSIHYGSKYNNAFWNGSQMTYGDGDGQIFVDFTRSNDVIGHELTHGVTQYTAGLVYSGEAGGLNESISDCFGSMFRQWESGQPAAKADWLIGAGILGPAAKKKGFTCLRDLSTPAAAHCLSKQPSNYSDYVPGSDPHISSGIPNHAFYLVATGIGGKSWEKAGKIWYAALTDPKATSTMKFKAFSNLTKSAAKALFPKDPSVYAAVAAGWKAVGV